LNGKLKTILFGLATAVMVLAVLELGLWLVASVSHPVERLLAPPWETWQRIDDPLLGHRPNPRFEGHDALGFRNSSVPERADVLVFGDSQSYGTQVERDEAWPRRLAAETGLEVYNMAYDEYGPAHALILLEEGLGFRPRYVIEAYYAGNDLYDSFKLVHVLDQLPELRTKDEARLDAIERAERELRLEDEAMRIFDMKPSPPEAAQQRDLLAPFRGLRVVVASRSRLYGLARALYHAVEEDDPRVGSGEVSWERMVAFAAGKTEFVQLLDAGGMRTVLTSRYRMTALDLDDPRIEEGLSISLGAIEEMNRRVQAAGAELIVLLVPTKETVFATVAPEELLQDDVYGRLLALEQRMWATSVARFDAAGIRTLDLTPVLRREVERDAQPYRIDWDGHPTASAHEAIAAAVAELLHDEASGAATAE